MFKKKDKADKPKKKGKKGEAEAAAPEADAATEAPKEGAEGEGAEAEAPKKKGLPIKMIAMALVALLVLGGGGGGAFYFLKVKPKADAAAAAGGKEEGGHKKEKKKEKKKEGHGEGGKEGEKTAIKEGPDGVFFYTLPSFQVNMQAADGRPTFMKLDLVLEIADEEIATNIEEEMPRVRDTLQTFLRELRPEDLSGSQGTLRLRQELQRRINLLISPAKVDSVLVEGLLIT